MIKTAKQLKDLIRNLSKKKSADAQILMRNYMMERFLERISLSQYQDKFILKGGMLVAAMVGLDARATMDIISFPMEDGVTFRIKQITEIMDGKVLGEALLATAKKRETEYHLNDAQEIFDEVQNDFNMQKLWKSYQKKFSYASDISWEMVMEGSP